MPIAVTPTETPAAALPKWQRPAKTTTNLPWAEIKVLDLAKYDQPGGKAQLAEELRGAVSWILGGVQLTPGPRHRLLQPHQHWLLARGGAAAV